MDSKDQIKLTGFVNIKVIDSKGNVKDERNVKNLVVTAGKNYLASWLAAASQSTYFMKYIAVGTGTTAPSASDTALQNEVARAAGSVSSSSNTWTNQATITATGAITEAGIFSASSGGTMLSRVTFSPVNLSAGDSIVINWSITFN